MQNIYLEHDTEGSPEVIWVEHFPQTDEDLQDLAQTAFNYGHKLAEGEKNETLTLDISKSVYDDGYRAGRKSLEPSLNKLAGDKSVLESDRVKQAQASFEKGFDNGFDAGWKAARGANTDVKGAVDALKAIATKTATEHEPTKLRITYDASGRMTGLREMKPGEPDDELSASREALQIEAAKGNPEAQKALRESIMGTPIQIR